jgi:hypothetical protein
MDIHIKRGNKNNVADEMRLSIFSWHLPSASATVSRNLQFGLIEYDFRAEAASFALDKKCTYLSHFVPPERARSAIACFVGQTVKADTPVPD